MSKLIVANWKMQLSIEESLRLASKYNSGLAISKHKVVVCPDFLSLPLISASRFNENFLLGAQNSAVLDRGPLTGEVSVSSLSEIGVDYVILGHSERRSVLLESDKEIRDKVAVALEAGLSVILCVGENKEERKAKMSKQVVSRQVKSALKDTSSKKANKIIVAYEPVWAIGSGEPMSSLEAEKMAQYIKKESLKYFNKPIKVLYGGSVDENNSHDFLKQKNISGLLIGGASLDIDKFLKICQV